MPRYRSGLLPSPTSSRLHRLLAFFHVRPFSPYQRLLWPRLTSSRASRHLSVSVAQGTLDDPPGYDAPTFTLMPVRSRSQRAVQVSGFNDIGRLAPLCRLVSASCSSGQRFASGFLQIRSYPQHPCLQLTLPLAGRVEDFHLQVSAPCRAHREKKPAMPASLNRHILLRCFDLVTN